MKFKSTRILAVAGIALAAPLAMAATAQSADPYLWLENIHGKRALAAVDAWNAKTMKALTANPQYEKDREQALKIMNDPAQIATPAQVLGQSVTNLWQDTGHTHGLWREADLASFEAGKPEWQTLIDLDALSKQEGQKWVWHGADCLPPADNRCLVALSPGGSDADIVREWDRSTKSFVKDGFTIPLAKSNSTWENADTLLIGTDWGAGSMTTSGYPRVVKRWKRGTPLADAKTVMEGKTTDVSVTPLTIVDNDGTAYHFINRGITFYTGENWIEGADGNFVKTPIPETANLSGVQDGRLIVSLKKPLGDIPAGSIVGWNIADVLAGKADAPKVVFAPSNTQAVKSIATTDHAIWINLLDNVAGKLLKLTADGNGGWTQHVAQLPGNATIDLDTADKKSDTIFATVQSFLTPPTLYAVSANGSAKVLQSLPAQFDATGMKVEQHFATSKDGTKIPYFMVRKAGAPKPGAALIHAYGGFDLPQLPSYLTTEPYRAGPVAMWWVQQGQTYVLANIRGGGEYGPRWHDAALRQNRQKAYDDLYAVAQDLISRGLTTKGKIAVSGRSNGGLMAGVAVTERPDLFGAAIIGSPLLDMKRYSHLLAGASWMAEYGNPDVPADWAFMRKYSPYQNIRKDVKYPPVFLYSSTEDDRVHPGHARKFAAKLMADGDPVFFHEYRFGGHSVGGDHSEDAVRAALIHAYLDRVLIDGNKTAP
ncbi:prolyl oligopeptidase family serine peptidase [Porphyrobacter algicida]|uniref:Prolyl oligopeptidase family serine peptidase n=1 Tax=Qipengyuania algicida TaxID=1836209 RepID=A0A845AE01_9SPHN|nr:prolyl oligopeptidase family serine peptidase [Qipengyuania algicida]MXP27717.1 prolyl oligopeptidase family serine peptidase [Qipengyuania algicida]